MTQMNAFLSFGIYVSGKGVGRQILATAVRSPKLLQIIAFEALGIRFWAGRRPPDPGRKLRRRPHFPDLALLAYQHVFLDAEGPDMNADLTLQTPL